jgi:phytoene synthase
LVRSSGELRAAYAACEALAQAHYENFPVASRLMPAHLRPHVAAVYAFARTADDFADEPGREADERLRLLADWRRRLHEPGKNDASPGANSPPGADHLPGNVFIALHDTIDRFSLPLSLFDDLLDAFMQDVVTTRYDTWAAVLDYCRRSANPVGRLVLLLSGYNTDELNRASDAVCSALQLTNFWQDLAVDWPRGRLYVPEEIWRQHGADPGDLDRRRVTPEWRAALHDCSHRTRALFQEGRAVCDGVSGRLRYELRATWLGGTRILDCLDRSGFDVFSARPKLGPADALVIACGTLLWRATPPSPTRS